MIKEYEIQYKDEIWRSILNSRYEVSNYGRFRKIYKYKCRYLKTFKKGSLQIIILTIDGKRKNFNVANFQKNKKR